LSLEAVSVEEVLHHCQAMIEPLAQKRGIALDFLKFDRPFVVFADRTRLQQVLVNLLSNSIKYNRTNGSVTVDCASQPPGQVRISVRDTGMGMAPERLEHLYQPFNRLGQEAGLEQGTGIGLVVTKRIVEAMRGTIGVESKVDVGTTFWIDLAEAEAAQFDRENSTAPSTRCVHANDSVPTHTVLYVEDNPANLKLVERLIARRADLTLLTAGTGDLGIELARTHQPDVILMDINLPGISGTKALALLQQETATARIPVVALSANASPRDIERGLAAGFLKYLTKPIKVAELMATLDLILQAGSRPRTPELSVPHVA
jgi:CheY-like chemotaxis protein